VIGFVKPFVVEVKPLCEPYLYEIDTSVVVEPTYAHVVYLPALVIPFAYKWEPLCDLFETNEV
jgi:hypothetical protein